MPEKQYFVPNPSLQIYKPSFRDYNNGSATQWEYNKKTGNFFIKFASQNEHKNNNGNCTFDWENGPEMTFSIWELGQISSVLVGRKSFLGLQDDKDSNKGKGLYHQTGNNNAVFKLDSQDGRKLLSVSIKKKGKLFRLSQVLSNEEAYTIAIVINSVIQYMYINPIPIEKKN